MSKTERPTTNDLTKKRRSLLRDSKGATVVEYAMLLVMMMLVGTATVRQLHKRVGQNIAECRSVTALNGSPRKLACKDDIVPKPNLQAKSE